MTDGLYRRIYAGFLTGRRINAVTIGAEMCFWRLQAVADDFGNLSGDTPLLCSMAFPLRRVTTQKLEGWIAELANARNNRGISLIRGYRIHGEPYIHIEDFERRQPARKNGRKLRRFPPPGESRGIQGNPGAEKSPDTDTDTDTDAQSDTDTDANSNSNSDTDADESRTGVEIYTEKPETAPDRASRPFIQVFVLRVAEAFRWTSVTAMGQRKSLSSIGRKLLREEDRETLAAELIGLARDKADDPALEKPVAAWQAEVTRLLKARDTKRRSR